MPLRRFCRYLACLTFAALHLPLAAQALEREYVLRWIPSASAVSGYRVYLSDQAQSAQVLDLGAVPPDGDGIARESLQLDATRSFSVSMTAYNDAGESSRSNEITIPASACDPASCDDGDPCTADDCRELACTHSPVPDGTACGGESICIAGACSVPQCLVAASCTGGAACDPDLDGDGVVDACDPDLDGDGRLNAEDDCKAAFNPDQTDTDGNGIGDACECGDQSGDGRVNSLDLVAIQRALLGLVPLSPLCDTNDDGRCNVSDILGASQKIFGRPAYCRAYPRPTP